MREGGERGRGRGKGRDQKDEEEEGMIIAKLIAYMDNEDGSRLSLYSSSNRC